MSLLRVIFHPVMYTILTLSPSLTHSFSLSLTQSLTLSLTHSTIFHPPSPSPSSSFIIYLTHCLHMFCTHTSSLPSSLPFSLSLSFRLPPSIYHSRCLSLLILLFFGQPSHTIHLSHFLPFPLPHLFPL